MGDRRLPPVSCMRFPLRIGAEGALASNRREHVREQVVQVIFTLAGERLFRPEFGGGLRQMVFEPNAPALWDMTRNRLSAALADALEGEVDPRTLEIEVGNWDAASGTTASSLQVRIGYRLAAMGMREEQTFLIGPGL